MLLMIGVRLGHMLITQLTHKPTISLNANVRCKSDSDCGRKQEKTHREQTNREFSFREATVSTAELPNMLNRHSKHYSCFKKNCRQCVRCSYLLATSSVYFWQQAPDVRLAKSHPKWFPSTTIGWRWDVKSRLLVVDTLIQSHVTV